jgi:hypothetical protein
MGRVSDGGRRERNLGGRGTRTDPVTDSSGIDWWGSILAKKVVVVLDREEGVARGARGARDEEEREARRRQMGWTCSGIIVDRVATETRGRAESGEQWRTRSDERKVSG